MVLGNDRLMQILRRIASIPLEDLRDSVFDLTPYASEERFRFINCDAFIDKRLLEIYEITELPDEGPDTLYSTVSYVWFGLTATADALRRDGSFRVYCGTHSDGMEREDGGPISMKVLEYACMQSTGSGVTYLWLDRLCIMQTSRRDKLWQIGRMYNVYEGCRECIVLPGGLQRLASVYEETSWASRAWTYQEAILTWDYATVLTKDWHRPKGEQHWLVEGECHWQYLHQLFVEGSDFLSNRTEGQGDEGDEGGAGGRKGGCLILGTDGRALDILRRIVEYKSWNLLAEESGDEMIKENTLRQLVLQGVAMRVSSRPVDMVFSVLGLVGVEEHFRERTKDFGENDRFAATLALIEAYLRLGTSTDVDNHSTLVDVPLWKRIERVEAAMPSKQEEQGGHDTTPIPSLQQLAYLLDGTPDQVANAMGWTAAPLSEWRYEVSMTEDEPDERASAIAREIPAETLLRAYRSEAARVDVPVEVDGEGIIELRRTLDPRSPFESAKHSDARFLLGWSLRLGGHPYIRFYRLNIAHVF